MSQTNVTETKKGIDVPVNSIFIPGCGMTINVDASSLPVSGGDNSSINQPPNLQIGKETKMNMRFMGKQVYAMLYDYGKLPEKGTKDVPMVEGVDYEWTQISADFSYVRRTDTKNIYPINNPWHSSWVAQITSSGRALTMTTNEAYGTFSAVICLLYTKQSDPVIS